MLTIRTQTILNLFTNLFFTPMKTPTEALMWRYATKQFDATKKIADEHIQTILESGHLSPSSYGLQPWKLILIENKDLREKLKSAAYNQSQVTDASHLIVIAHRNDMSEEYIDSYMKSIATTRGIEVSSLDGFKAAITGAIAHRNPEDIKAWNARQTYIPLGIMLETAALLEIDSCPMEGFDTKAFDEILGITGMGYSSVVMLTLGYRANEDASAHYKKSRFPFEEIVIKK